MFAYSWDEWVPSNRLLKFNETNLATQKSLQQSNAPAASTAAAAKAASRAANKDGGGVGTRGARKDGTRGTKRGREEVCAAELFFLSVWDQRILLQDESSKKPDIKLNIPEILKGQLVDDWESVTKNNQVCAARM